MPATSARIYRERGPLSVSRSYRGILLSESRRYRRRESPVFRNVNASARGRPYMGSRRRLALVRVIGIMSPLSFSPTRFFPFGGVIACVRRFSLRASFLSNLIVEC